MSCSPPHGDAQLGAVSAGVDPGLGEGEDDPGVSLHHGRDAETGDRVRAALRLLNKCRV